MDAMASKITSFTVVYSTVFSSTDHGKQQSSASLAFVRGIHRWPVNSLHKWAVTRKMFPFDDVIMMVHGHGSACSAGHIHRIFSRIFSRQTCHPHGWGCFQMLCQIFFIKTVLCVLGHNGPLWKCMARGDDTYFTCLNILEDGESMDLKWTDVNMMIP